MQGVAVVEDNFLERIAQFSAGGGAFATVLVAGRWLINWASSRVDRRETLVDNKMEALIKGLDGRVMTLTDRLDTVEDALAECKRMHAVAEAEVLRLSALIQAQGEIRQSAQAVVAADRLALKNEK